MATNTEPRVRTYSDAFKLSTSIPAAQLLDLIEANGNPVIYRPRCQARIAFSINIFGRDRAYPFIGYDYCDRAGYTQADTVDLFAYSGGRKQPVVFHLESKGDRAPESGYFHAGTSQIHPVVEDSLVSVDGIDAEVDTESAFAKGLVEKAQELLFAEINGGPQKAKVEIAGLTAYVTPDRADVDAASLLPASCRGRHGWIRFHFTAPTRISYVEMVDRLAPGEYAPEQICPGDLVSIPGKTDAVRVAKVVDYHGRQTKPIQIHLENGGVIGTTYLADGGLIEVR